MTILAYYLGLKHEKYHLPNILVFIAASIFFVSSNPKIIDGLYNLE